MTKQTILSDDACWAALAARDKTADTLFVYAVKTTQTWGFPSTVVRLPKRENTEFLPRRKRRRLTATAPGSAVSAAVRP